MARAFVTKARSQPAKTAMFFMESFMEKLMGTSKYHPIQVSKIKRNPLYFKRIALFEKVEKYFSESLGESMKGINVVSDNLNPDDHSHHTLTPYLLRVSVGYPQRKDACSWFSKSVECNHWLSQMSYSNC